MARSSAIPPEVSAGQCCRTPPAEIRAAIEDPEGLLIVGEAPSPAGEGGTQLVAFAIGAPLEHSTDVEGPDDDPMLGKHNTMYSVSITVAPSYQSAGIGRKLKELQDPRDSLVALLREAHQDQVAGIGFKARWVESRRDGGT